jgi:hypothetical protein
MNLPRSTVIRALAALSACLCPALAFAYVGPGAGITAIGSVLALIMGVLLAIVGFVWYPLKRLFKNLTGKRDTDQDADKPAGSDNPDQH